MPTQKIDPKVIFASNAPAIDKPPVFSDKTKGWDVSRVNDGRPTIKEMNKVQQDTDLKILWLNENSVTPYDASIDYPDGAVAIKDGSFKQLVSDAWVEFLDDFANKDEVKRGIANRYDSSLTYNSGERVVLTNGDIVKSTIDGNTNDPNVDMTGWVKTNSASQVFDESGKDQQEINDIQAKGLPLITYFGAIADGTFRKIKDVDPSITLAEVQSVGGASATLDSSHDWFIAQRLANQNRHFRIGDESQLVIDRPLIILHHFYTIYARAGKHSIQNIGVGTSGIIIGGVGLAIGVRICGGVRGVHWGAGRTGHGVEIAYGARINLSGMYLYQNGGSGIYSGANQHCWGLKADGIFVTNNAINGVELVHSSAFQKNAVSITNSEINGNGINQVNGQPYYNAKIVTYDHGHGLKISGTGYNITGSTIEGNSAAGVYVGGSNAQQVMGALNITGCYFEPNLLADIYLDNSVAGFEDIVIKGNYRGAIRAGVQAEKGHIFAVRPRLIMNSDIQDLFVGESTKYLKDIRVATSLFVGGEMQTDNMFNTVKDGFAKVGSNVVRLTNANNNLQNNMNYLDGSVLFNASSYVFDLEYLWERAGLTSTSTATLGFIAVDYDDKPISTYTTPQYKAVGVNYATVQTDVAASSTGAIITVVAGELAGWDTATFNFLNIYNTVLSNGVAVGAEYTHNFKPSNTVSINAGSNTITLTGSVPEIKAGTKIGLGNSSAGAFIWNGLLAYEDESLKRKKWSVNLGVITYAKWIKSFRAYLTLNSAVGGESLSIRRIRIRELSSLLMNGATAQRPVLTADQRSFKYYDNSINKEVTWSGTQWLTAMYLEYNQMNAIESLVSGADLATTVLKVNALLTELKSKGLMKNS